MTTHREDEALIARVREALAEDSRTHELDIVVSRTVAGIRLRGPVLSPERRQAAEQVAREHVPPDLEVVNETWVAHYEPPQGVEKVR